MARVCEVCGKKTSFGHSIARRGLAKKKGGVGKKITGISHRKFKPNLQNIEAVVNGKITRIRVCTKCLRSGKITKPPIKSKSNLNVSS